MWQVDAGARMPGNIEHHFKGTPTTWQACECMLQLTIRRAERANLRPGDPSQTTTLPLAGSLWRPPSLTVNCDLPCSHWWKRYGPVIPMPSIQRLVGKTCKGESYRRFTWTNSGFVELQGNPPKMLPTKMLITSTCFSELLHGYCILSSVFAWSFHKASSL